MHAMNSTLYDYFSGTTQTFIFWLFPLSYLIHIGEEYWAGFPEYMQVRHNVGLTSGRFLLLQMVGLSLMVLGLLLARRLHFPNLMLAILSAVVITNALVHLVRSIQISGYEPGLASACLIWIPLGFFTLTGLSKAMTINRYGLALSIGVSIGAAVEVVARLK